MKKKVALFLALVLSWGCSVESPFYSYNRLEAEKTLKNPCIIHMMFFPWDRQQHLLADEFAFDSTPYLEMKKRVQEEKNARVVMWTYGKTKEFCQKYYPKVWKSLETYADRPVMYIDVLRWLVVYHFGGIYWQYDSVPLAQSMKAYLPEKRTVRLFTEGTISPEFSQKMAQQPIRKGKPEEQIRVATQIFSSAFPKNTSVKKILKFFLHRLKTEKVSCDYDILYITGNAGMSEYYDLHGKKDAHVELTPLEQTRSMVNVNSKGRWRTDNGGW